MAVNVSCSGRVLAVGLDLTAGEYLVYEVSFLGAQAVFAITDLTGAVILSPSTPPVTPGKCRTRWPLTTPSQDDVTHTLVVHFVAATQYIYSAIRYDKSGNQLQTCKNCTYASTTATDYFPEALRILLTK
jgi:hypothetical protein